MDSTLEAWGEEWPGGHAGELPVFSGLHGSQSEGRKRRVGTAPGSRSVASLAGRRSSKGKRVSSDGARGPRGCGDLEARCWQVGEMRAKDAARCEVISHVGKEVGRVGTQVRWERCRDVDT